SSSTYPSMLTSMSASQGIWQVLEWGIPLTMARHSKHIPMPQSAARGSPVTDVRQGCPAIAIATATVEPAGTAIDCPLTRTVRSLNMDVLLCRPREQVRLHRNLRGCACHLVDQNSGSSERCGYAEAFVAGRQKNRLATRTRADEGQ